MCGWANWYPIPIIARPDIVRHTSFVSQQVDHIRIDSRVMEWGEYMGEWHPIKELLSTPINKVLWFSFFYCVCSQFVVVAKKHPPKLHLLSMFRWLTPDWRFPWKQTALNTKGKWPKTRQPADNYSWKQARSVSELCGALAGVSRVCRKDGGTA